MRWTDGQMSGTASCSWRGYEETRDMDDTKCNEIEDGLREEYGGMINKCLRRVKVCLRKGTESV